VRLAIVDLIEHAHVRSAIAGNVVAQMHLLKVKRPDEYREERRPSGLDKDEALLQAVEELATESGSDEA
jgi:hypothetical protein